MCIYFWERQRQNASGLGAEREGDTEAEAGSKLRAISTEPDAGLELKNREIMTWAEVGRSTDWTTQAPPKAFSSFMTFFVYRFKKTVCRERVDRTEK